eukprot:SAG11_NODE_313_length_10878_cov_43.354578_14_plen_109_part_00
MEGALPYEFTGTCMVQYAVLSYLRLQALSTVSFIYLGYMSHAVYRFLYQVPLHLGDSAQAVASLYLYPAHTSGPNAHHLSSAASLYPTDFYPGSIRYRPYANLAPIRY